MYRFDANGQLMMLELEAAEGTGAPPKRRPVSYTHLSYWKCGALGF